MRAIKCAVTAIAAALLIPATAGAQSGSIANIVPTGTGTLQATFSGSYAPSSSGFWYLSAYWRPIGSDCLDDIGAIIWVSNASMMGPGTITETATFYPPTSQAFNVCLYLNGPGNPYLLSLNSYWPPLPPAPAPPPPAPEPAPAPVKAPAPAPVAESKQLPTLSQRSARRYLGVALKRRFDAAWTAGYAKRLNCHRSNRTRLSCRVAWVVGDLSFSGRANIWYAHDQKDRTAWFYSWRIKRVNEYCSSVRHGKHCVKTYVS
jgi:hypothetical protein